MPDNSAPAPGWYRDPTGPGERWWNGVSWSEAIRQPVPQAPLPPRAVAPLAPPAPGVVPIPPPPAGGFPVPPYAMTPVAPGMGGWAPHPAARPPVTGMGSAIRAVFGQYATFTGRATRSEYWYWYLFDVIVTFGAVFLIWIPIIGSLLVFGLVCWFLVAFIPTLAVTVRRLRDAGLSWGFLFLQLVPFGGIVLIVLLAQPSKAAPQPHVGQGYPAYVAPPR